MACPVQVGMFCRPHGAVPRRKTGLGAGGRYGVVGEKTQTVRVHGQRSEGGAPRTTSRTRPNNLMASTTVVVWPVRRPPRCGKWSLANNATSVSGTCFSSAVRCRPQVKERRCSVEGVTHAYARSAARMYLAAEEAGRIEVKPRQQSARRRRRGVGRGGFNRDVHGANASTLRMFCQ